MSEKREWRTKDKSEWGPGPWQDEPDKVQWVDEATGLDCLIVRNNGGNLCGYVGVPDSHPWHGKDYGACVMGGCEDEWCGHRPESLTEVHGGLTFADGCHEPTEEQYRSIPAKMTDPTRLAEAARYPRGDYARNLHELREQVAQTFEEWVADQQGRRICHVPEPGRPGNVWWFGFDCGHAGDVSPGYDQSYRAYDYGTYKDRAYVERNCASLAKQLADVPAPALPAPTQKAAEEAVGR